MNEVTEMCGNCMSENTFDWDVKTDGYKAYCPHCGEEMMLCDECKHAEDNPNHICPKICLRKTLKPCPFCGGKAFAENIRDVEGDFFMIHCDKCGASTCFGDNSATIDNVLEAWNTRLTEKEVRP
jgi:Lar family restriction alleviation protein